jgi:hypothetical protein
MMHTLALLAVLQAPPAQGGGLALADARITAGILGPTRKRTEFLPGDSLFVSFDIEGVTIDGTGKVQYRTSTEVTDGAGKVVFRQPPRDLEAHASLGGGRIPAFAQVDVGLDQSPGDYAIKVTITDRANNKSQTLTQPFKVLPPAFGLVRGYLTCDHEGRVPAGMLTSGHVLFVNFALVGFSRDKAKGQPNVTFEMRVLGEDGKPTLAKPLTGVINQDVPANAVSLPAQFVLSLNRPGKFTLELKATDQVGGKTLTESYPFTVLANH